MCSLPVTQTSLNGQTHQLEVYHTNLQFRAFHHTLTSYKCPLLTTKLELSLKKYNFPSETHEV